VADQDGEPLAGAWVALPELGLLASSQQNGRFIFNRVPSGKHKVVARTRDGDEVEAEVDVPGTKLDLVVGAPSKKK
jgi:hypothetical protein